MGLYMVHVLLHGSWLILHGSFSNQFVHSTDTGKVEKIIQLLPVRDKSWNFEKMSESQGIVREFK